MYASENKTFVYYLRNVGRWADVVQMLYKCFVFAGIVMAQIIPQIIISYLRCGFQWEISS